MLEKLIASVSKRSDQRREVSLNVLLSAYACEPGKGSEPGVGWNWMLEIARLGHKVWVLTRENNRPSIEANLEASIRSNIVVLAYDLPRWARWWKKGGRGVQLYYFLWQWGAYRLASQVSREVHFDLVHHLTFGVFRTPSFLWKLKKPLIVGPVGGGEKTPSSLRVSYPVRGRLMDAIRSISNWISVKNPLVRIMLSSSTLILCRTQETLELIPAQFRRKCRLHADVGIAPNWIVEPYRKQTELRLLSVSRLLYWKGIQFTLEAFALVCKQIPDSWLTIIGEGPDQKWLMQRARHLGIMDRIEWVKSLSHEQLRQVYKQSSLLMFPTLHDSGGSVALEALACGTPVICLDINGPSIVVPAGCGLKLHVGDKTENQISQELADNIILLASDPTCLQELSEYSIKMAYCSSWSNLVRRAYSYPEVIQVIEGVSPK